MRYAGIFWLSLGCLFAACGTKQPEPLVPAAGVSRESERAVERLTQARCDYEQRCNGIGPTAKFSDRNHCENVARDEARGQMNQCREGVDQADLNDCIREISERECSGTFEGIGPYKSCRLDDLCD